MKSKLKKLWQSIREKTHKVWVWLRKNALNKDMFLSFLIAELIFWSPNIVCGILALVVSPWWWTAFSSIIVFWAGPFTPAVPLQIGLALAIKKLFTKIKRRKEEKKK